MTDLDAAILDIESRWWRRPGAKHNAISELGITPTRYAQRLNRIIDTPEAVAAAPVVVHRLQRIRDEARRGQG